MRLLPLITLSLCLSSHAMAFTLNGKSYQFEPVNDQVHVMHGPLAIPNKANQGFMNNPAIIEGEKSLVLIDPGSTKATGEIVLKEIAQISNKPIAAIFVTHIHGDHWLANHTILEKHPNAKVYAHANMIQRAKDGDAERWLEDMKQLTEGASLGTEIHYPTHPVDNEQRVTVDDMEFTIHHHGKAHTDTDIVIEHHASKTLFLGDNAFVLRFGQFDDSSSLHGNIELLKTAQKNDIRTFVPGHGPTGNAKQALEPFLHYLVKLREKVAAGYENGDEDYEIKAKILKDFEDYAQWSGFDFNFGKHVNRMFLEVEEKSFE